MTRIQNFKKQLARIFDNDLRTKQWENYPDYAIIGLIVLSTLSVFISTFNVGPLCEKVLSVIDIVTDVQRGVAYDLTGRRVSAPAKGIYIVDGVKKIVK